MKLSEWAKKVGINYATAWRLWKNGNLPVRATQLRTGTILVEDSDIYKERNEKTMDERSKRLLN